jgi:hypothetical protein
MQIALLLRARKTNVYTTGCYQRELTLRRWIDRERLPFCTTFKYEYFLLSNDEAAEKSHRILLRFADARLVLTQQITH